MAIEFNGTLSDRPRIRAGFVGCGSHSYRNIYPALQFAPVELVATCDLQRDKAGAFARQFGAERAYDDYHRMLDAEQLDAVFIVTGYDEQGRPSSPSIAVDVLGAGCHVWMEKPPAATCADVDRMIQAAQRNQRHGMVGFKKMFFPANEKAYAITHADDFGPLHLATFQYPQHVPTVDDMHRYFDGERVAGVVSFLDHLCHPMSLALYLLGMPDRLYYERTSAGGGAVTLTYDSGVVGQLALTHGQAGGNDMERTVLVGDNRHVVVENNIRVWDRRPPRLQGYGRSPSYYAGEDDGSRFWEPEFSLGQLYNKSLFIQGFYGEITEFANAILENRAPAKGTLAQARQVTQVFEAFAHGPGQVIAL